MPRNTRRASLRKYRLAGGTFEDAAHITYDVTLEQARAEHWQPSELAATLADILYDLAAVYGKRAVRAKYGKDSI